MRGSRLRRSRPALVEDMSDRDKLGSCLYRHNVQLTLELVDVDVAAAQVSHSAVELERVTGVQHSAVVKTDHFARLQSGLQPRGRLVQ